MWIFVKITEIERRRNSLDGPESTWNFNKSIDAKNCRWTGGTHCRGCRGTVCLCQPAMVITYRVYIWAGKGPICPGCCSAFPRGWGIKDSKICVWGCDSPEQSNWGGGTGLLLLHTAVSRKQVGGLSRLYDSKEWGCFHGGSLSCRFTAGRTESPDATASVLSAKYRRSLGSDCRKQPGDSENEARNCLCSAVLFHGFDWWRNWQRQGAGSACHSWTQSQM